MDDTAPASSGAAASPADATVDLLVVGGGVNGAGIARDAAGRGWSVVLCERDDLAGHTSSASTKLIHGGLRYLEHHAFGLVRKALVEREVLLRVAPHIIRPMRFVLPHDPSMRPAWMMRIGLFLYDHLARRELLPGSTGIDLRTHPAGGKLLPRYRQGFVYSDGWVDDARLVVLNAVGAAADGAVVLTRTACTGARVETGTGAGNGTGPGSGNGTGPGIGNGTGSGSGAGAAHWVATLRDGATGAERTIRARALVNATGQWAAQFLADGLHRRGEHGLRRVKGSHIVVRRLFDHPYAYLLQNDDGRIVFAIPYESDFTLIGTTDVELTGPPAEAAITADEVDYLCGAVNRYFTRRIGPADVVWSYSGVRPLMDDEAGDASAVTRDYALELPPSGPPLLTVWGGKITTFRRLAEEAVDRLAARLPGIAASRPSGWTATVPLPGGDVAGQGAERCLDAVRHRYPWLPEALARRWAVAYGTRVEFVAGAAVRIADLGEEIAPGLFAAELAYWRAHEWARTADDALWRRSKLGLRLPAEAHARVAAWFGSGAAGARS